MLPKIIKIGATLQLRLNKCSGSIKRKACVPTQSNQGVFYVLPIIFLNSKVLYESLNMFSEKVKLTHYAVNLLLIFMFTCLFDDHLKYYLF
jgi:NADH:ubiquinone oxidoreductase subunit H